MMDSCPSDWSAHPKHPSFFWSDVCQFDSVQPPENSSVIFLGNHRLQTHSNNTFSTSPSNCRRRDSSERSLSSVILINKILMLYHFRNRFWLRLMIDLLQLVFNSVRLIFACIVSSQTVLPFTKSRSCFRKPIGNILPSGTTVPS